MDELIEEILKEADKNGKSMSAGEFNTWAHKFPLKQRLHISKYWGTDIYQENISGFMAVMIYLPSTVRYKHEDMTHEFDLCIDKKDGNLTINYYHVQQHSDIDINNSGLTNTWYNPIKYFICNELHSVQIESEECFIDAVRSMYEFLVNNEVITE